LVFARLDRELDRGLNSIPSQSRKEVVSQGSRGRDLCGTLGIGAITRHLWGRFGGASNCLIIAVTRDELVVSPRFPFNLMFLPEIYGLELQVPKSLVEIEHSQSGLLRNRVTVRVDGADSRRMQLKVKGRQAFLAALEAK
jgi:hypothetical protein